MDERARHALEQIADAAGVAEVQVQVVDDDQEDAAGRVIPWARRRQDDPFLSRGRRRRLQIVNASAMDECEGGDVLLDTVFEDLEVVLGEIGHELVTTVADDRVHRDEVHARAEVRLARLLPRRCLGCRRCLRCWCLGCWRCLGCLGCLRRHTHCPGRQSHCEACRQTGRIELHDDSIRRLAAGDGLRRHRKDKAPRSARNGGRFAADWAGRSTVYGPRSTVSGPDLALRHPGTLSTDAPAPSAPRHARHLRHAGGTISPCGLRSAPTMRATN